MNDDNSPRMPVRSGYRAALVRFAGYMRVLWSDVERRLSGDFEAPRSMVEVVDAKAVGVALAVGSLALAVAVADHRTTPFDALFDGAGGAHKIDPDLLRAVARVESGFNPKAVSDTNTNGTRDYGLMQINEHTASGLHVPVDTLLDPVVSIRTACLVLIAARTALGSTATTTRVIAAYNAGPFRVLQSGIVNPAYVSAVMYHHTLYSWGRAFA